MEQPKQNFFGRLGAKRVRNFNEVSPGYSKKLAVNEARRCGGCVRTMCAQGCPLGIDIPGFIRLIREGDTNSALELIKRQNPFPAVCGRVCGAPCESSCVLTSSESDSIKVEGPTGIRALERYAADFGKSNPAKKKQPPTGKKAAIVGSGPSGLTAAAVLARGGYRLSVFELLDKPGGVLRYGIPGFRLPRKVLDSEINEIKSLGVDIITNCYASKTVTFEDLWKEGFKAVLIATGAGIPKFLDIPGTNLGGVYYGEEFLMRVNSLGKNAAFLLSFPFPTSNLPPASKNSKGDLKLCLLRGSSITQSIHCPFGTKVVVIGSGNMALDCARAAVRLGAEVTLLSSQPTDDRLTVRKESEYAQEEGVHSEVMVKVTGVLGGPNNFVSGVKCLRLDYADIQGKGQWELASVPDSEFTLEADTVILVNGHTPNTLINRGGSRLRLNDDGTIWVDAQNSMTSLEGVFAAGNVATNSGGLVQAMASGKKTAERMDQYLKTAH